MLTLDMSVGMADRVFYLTGPLPAPGDRLELCRGAAREVVLVEACAGALSVAVQRAVAGVAREWLCGQVLRWPLEYTALNGSPWWECSVCGSPVTGPGRDRHADWHRALQVSV